jgi:predicted nucleic acid-binding protein
MLDTSVLIDVLREREPALSQVRQWIVGREELGVCAIQIAEFMSGGHPQRRVVEYRFLTALRWWDVTPAASAHAGFYRYDFARQGVQFDTPDPVIAAVAREWSAVLVTGNVRDFPKTDIQVRALLSDWSVLDRDVAKSWT